MSMEQVERRRRENPPAPPLVPAEQLPDLRELAIEIRQEYIDVQIDVLASLGNVYSRACDGLIAQSQFLRRILP